MSEFGRKSLTKTTTTTTNIIMISILIGYSIRKRERVEGGDGDGERHFLHALCNRLVSLSFYIYYIIAIVFNSKCKLYLKKKPIG